MTDASEPLLKVSRLISRISAETVLRVDDLVINAGEHWLIYGQNGAGKSLLSAFLLGDLPLGRHRLWQRPGLPGRIASVSFDVQRQLAQAEQRHDISEYSESAHDEGTRVADLLSLRDSQSCDVESLLQTLGVEELLDRGIRYLSSGQFRRVMLARALCQNPLLLILDSPLDSIDAVSAVAIRSTLTEWMGPGKSIIEFSRSLDESLPGYTHMALMSECALVSAGPVTDLDHVNAFNKGSAAVLPEPVALPQFAQSDSSYPDEWIRMRNVNASYGSRAVIKNLNWLVRLGDQVLIEGPNGCGKSTLLSLLTGENNFGYVQGSQQGQSQGGPQGNESGQGVWLFGQPWGKGQSVWDIKKHFGVVSNHLHLSFGDAWSVLDVVCSGFEDSVGYYGIPRASQQRRARAWLAAVHLLDKSDNAFGRLSFGQQKLALLARSMVKSPPLLILDEPLVGLDDYHRRLFLSLLSRVVSQAQTQLLYVSHTIGERPDFLNRRLTYVGDGHWESAELTPSA